MKRIMLILVAIATIAGVVAAVAPGSQADEAAAAIAGGKLPGGYRDWRLVSVAREEGELDDVRAILGNDVAITAYREGTHSFPEGTIIARIAWSYEASEENNKVFGKAQSFVAGAPKNGVQFMVKDATHTAASWESDDQRRRRQPTTPVPVVHPRLRLGPDRGLHLLHSPAHPADR